MVTTQVPPLRPLKPNNDLQAFVEQVHESLCEAQGDEDKADTIDDSCYYEGNVNALQWVLDQLTVPPSCSIDGVWVSDLSASEFAALSDEEYKTRTEHVRSGDCILCNNRVRQSRENLEVLRLKLVGS